MGKGYWFKIVAGALGIFAIGMFIVSAARTGKEHVETLIASNAPFTVPLFSQPFTLEGRNLGELKSLRVERSAPRSLKALHLKIDLDDPAALAPLASCDLSLNEFTDIEFDQAEFTCVSPLDMDDLDMIPFGTITFQPSGQEHILNLPREVVEELQNEIGDAMAEVGDAFAEIGDEFGSERIQVKINGRNVVDLFGGEDGGSLVIRDPASGRMIVEAKGGTNGATITIDTDAAEAVEGVPAPKISTETAEANASSGP